MTHRNKANHSESPAATRLSFIQKGVCYLLLLCLSGCGAEDIEVISPTVYYLSELEVEGFDFDNDFERETLGVYRLDVGEDVNEVHVRASALDDNINITVEAGSEKRFDTYEHGGVVDRVFQIEEGNNNIRLILSDASDIDDDEAIETAYTLNVYKIRSTASISSLAVYDFIGSGEEIGLTPAFSPNVFSYELSVPFNTCAIGTSAITTRRESSLIINGEDVDSNELLYYTLTEGENVFDIVSSSEDEKYSETYTLYIERMSPSDALQDTYANIQEIELGDVDFDFVCGINQSSLSLNNSVNSIPIYVKPAIEGAKVYLNDREVNAEETFQYEVDENSGEFTISVRSLDGQSTTRYTFNYTRYSRNVVNVSTTQELQSALKNAQPNDEIRIAEGTYQGGDVLATSGLSSAYFYSDRSGTSNENIYLIGDNQDVIISGESMSQNSVLTLSGNYWQVSSLEITNAKHGVVVDGGSFNILRNLSLNDIGQSAISIVNGAEYNTMALNVFSDIGQLNTELANDKLAAIAIGDDESTWGEPLLAENSGNTVRHNTFLSLGNAVAVHIEEGSQNTRLEFNQFVEEKVNGEGDRDSLVVNQGRDTLMRFNYFEYDIATPLKSVIQLQSSSAPSEGVQWGENTVLYENAFDLDNRQIPLIGTENIASVTVAENIRYDDQPVEYSSSVIEIDSTIVPTYQIQLAKDTAKCVGVEYLDKSDNEDEYDRLDVDRYYRLKVKNCSVDNDTLWKVHVDTGPYVRIESLGVEEDGAMRTEPGFPASCAEGQNNTVYLDEDIQGYTQRWLLDEVDGDIYIRSKRSLSYVLSIPGATLSNDLTMSTCALVGSDQQKFKLNRVN